MTQSKAQELKEKCFKLKFVGSEILFKYNNSQLAKICNGIGADWFPDYFRDIVSWIFNYLSATAFLHDVEYEAQIGLSLANEHFLINGEIEIKSKFTWYNPMRYIAMRRLKQFYHLLETFGHVAYKIAGLKKK
jgi:hypothetical protein